MSAATTSLQDERRRARTAPAARHFLHEGGWRAVSPRSGNRAGMVAHRGVLYPGEYVDRARLVTLVEERLGFTLDELRWVYRQGRKSAAQRELRARVEARLLEVAGAGGNLRLLAGATGLADCTLYRALKRARAGVT